jgi:hypothetical protein
VIYLYMDRLQLRVRRRKHARSAIGEIPAPHEPAKGPSLT